MVWKERQKYQKQSPYRQNHKGNRNMNICLSYTDK